jgi:hypothetical protein
VLDSLVDPVDTVMLISLRCTLIPLWGFQITVLVQIGLYWEVMCYISTYFDVSDGETLVFKVSMFRMRGMACHIRTEAASLAAFYVRISFV